MDVALANSGASIALATSYDENHPPENMIDGSMDTFWVSTGMYPQEIVISFPGMMQVTDFKMNCSNVKDYSIEKTTNTKPVDFEMLTEQSIEKNDQLQLESVRLPQTNASHVRLLIKSGFDHFTSIHKINIVGEPAS